MRANLVGPDDPRWTAALDRLRHDVYHLPGYARFAARHHERGEVVAFVAEEDDRRLLIPLLLRPLPLKLAAGATGRAALRDATSPRGYSGPIADSAARPASPEFVGRALEALAPCIRDAGIVTLFCRLHPLLHPESDTGTFARAGTLVEHGESVSIDLALDDDAWRRAIRNNHRRDIDRARRDGFVARIDHDWECFEQFLSAYDESMERVGAAPFWRLSREYFIDLRAVLGGHLHLCVVERDGEVAAAGLLTEVDGIVEYHLAGTVDRYVGASPSKVIVDFARRWARDRGNRTLHLGGSLGTGDSLHHFKIGFSPIRHRVRSWRLVADEDANARLVAAWAAASGRAPDDHGFFPAYRRPTAGRSLGGGTGGLSTPGRYVGDAQVAKSVTATFRK